MARYRDAKCKLCRREGGKLFLKGDKCYMEKCPFNKRPVLLVRTVQTERRFPNMVCSFVKSKRRREFTAFKKVNSVSITKWLTA